MDNHRPSRHTSELDAMSAEEEYSRYIDYVKELMKAFPKGTIVLGNHCLIPQRQMKEIGLPTSMLKDLNALYGLTKDWLVEPRWHIMDFENGKVLVQHGVNSNGPNGAINTALAKSISFVQGHTHAFGGVQYRQQHDRALFGLNTGCLFDQESYAARYAQDAKFNGVTGCGVVFSAEDAIFEKMPTGY
jgi:hypothetical protein